MNVQVDREGDFILKNRESAISRDVYTVRVDEGKTPVIKFYSAITPDAPAEEVVIDSAKAAATHMQSRLEARGLYKKEAAGMVKIWSETMFEKPGHRAMYMMDEADIEKMLPLRISPEPKEQKRVILVRLDCLGPSARQDIETWIQQLASENFRVRKDAVKKLTASGRIGEAVMREAYSKTKDPEVKLSLKEIIETITPKNPAETLR